MAEPLWINGKSFTAYGLVRRGRSLTSQTAFGGQLPYKGSLGRPAANNGRYTQLVYEEWFCDLRIMISANGISRDSHNGPSHEGFCHHVPSFFFVVCSTEFVVCREDFKFKAIC